MRLALEALVAAFWMVLWVHLVKAEPFSHQPVAFQPRHHVVVPGQVAAFLVRGGATVEDEVENEIEEEDEEESEEEEEEEKGEFDAALAASVVKKTQRQVPKRTSPFKEKANKLARSKKGNGIKIFRVPYIFRALLNPLTAFAMTKAYWASLFRFDYLKLKEDTSQELRSALEEKARKGGSGGSGGRGKRKMKRGQAKTLSDLPKLNT